MMIILTEEEYQALKTKNSYVVIEEQIAKGKREMAKTLMTNLGDWYRAQRLPSADAVIGYLQKSLQELTE